MKRLALIALLCAAPLAAQEEPTPFWIAPSETKPAKPPPAKKKKKPLQVEPVEVKRKKAPPPKKQPVVREQPTWIEPVTPAPRKPAPPPEPVVKRQPVQPISPEPEPEPEPVRTPVAPAASERRPVTPITPSPPPPPPLPPIAEPAATRIPEPAPMIRPEPEQPLDAPLRASRQKWSAGALLGAWSKTRSDGTGSSWDLAYGIRVSRAFLQERLEAEFQAIRAGGSSGSPFVSTATTHNLFALRGAWVWGPERWQFLAGGGVGFTLAQTVYSLQDVGGTPTSLPANSGRLTWELLGAARVRIFGGLEGRVEVDGVLRDGHLEWAPLLSLGWAF